MTSQQSDPYFKNKQIVSHLYILNKMKIRVRIAVFIAMILVLLYYIYSAEDARDRLIFHGKTTDDHWKIYVYKSGLVSLTYSIHDAISNVYRLFEGSMRDIKIHSHDRCSLVGIDIIFYRVIGTSNEIILYKNKVPTIEVVDKIELQQELLNKLRLSRIGRVVIKTDDNTFIKDVEL